MTEQGIVAFMVVVGVVVLAPGADFALVLRNAIVGGRGRGRWTILGVAVASTLQGALAAFGVGSLIVRVQPVFLTVKWAGVAYLLWLGASALRDAWRGRYADVVATEGSPQGEAWLGFRQGVLCNLTNPKILVFYLALLPQFVAAQAPLWSWLAHAWLVPLAGTLWLLTVVELAHLARRTLVRRRVRRSIDAISGTVLIGLGVRVATEG